MSPFPSIRATTLALAIAIPAAAGAQPQASPAGTSSFTIFFRGLAIGNEQTRVVRSGEGWTITGSGRTGAPIGVITKTLQIRYDADWKPLEVIIDATAGGNPLTMHTVVSGTSAATHSTMGTQAADKNDTIAQSAVLLPNPFWAAYEALAFRLKGAASGTTISVYVPPQASLDIRVGDTATENIQTVSRLIEATHTHVTMTAAGAPPVDADIWFDETGRLLRVSVPAQTVDCVRDDVASVTTRRVAITRAGDEQVRVPANGFILAGTLSKPADAAGKKLPAVILIGGSGPTDRDEIVAGIPVLGQLAGHLADAGFLVLRYDKRGVGQSGGRVETAGLADFAEDLRAAVKFMAKRKDVDTRRIIVAGHSEGGAVALMAAAKEHDITAVITLAAPGISGSDLVLEQQRHALARSNLSDAEKDQRINLQKRIHEAVLTGKGWESVPGTIRQQVDNPEFASMLAFDPAKVMPDVRQPVLIVQGALDTQVEPSNASRLETLARARKHTAPVEVATIPGINHLFVPATTGEVDEYGSLKEKAISPAVAQAITAWLQKTFTRTAGLRSGPAARL